MSWASAKEHVTFSLALLKSKNCGKKSAKNARIPALGYRALKEEEVR